MWYIPELFGNIFWEKSFKDDGEKMRETYWPIFEFEKDILLQYLINICILFLFQSRNVFSSITIKPL